MKFLASETSNTSFETGLLKSLYFTTRKAMLGIAA